MKLNKHTVIVASIALGAGLFGGLILGVTGSWIVRKAAASPDTTRTANSQSNTSTLGKTTYTREEFEKLVVGKTKDQVLAAVGKPVSTTEIRKNNHSWYYPDCVLNPATGKYSAAYVRFNGDIAAEVGF